MSAPAETCEQIKTLLPWYANGTLSDEEKLRVTRHLHRCPLCRQALIDALHMRRLIRRSLQQLVTETPGATSGEGPLARMVLQQLSRHLQVEMLGRLLVEAGSDTAASGQLQDIYSVALWRWIPPALSRLLRQHVA